MDAIDRLFGPGNGDASIAQMCLRADCRAADFSQLFPLDTVAAVVGGSNISRMMTGKSSFVPGLAATLLLVVLHRLLAICAIGSKRLSRLLKGEPVTFVRDGQKNETAMRRSHMGDDDLLEGLRMQQVARIEDVRLASLERGGKIRVVRRSSEAGTARKS